MEKNEARERLTKLRDEFTSTVNTLKERLVDPQGQSGGETNVVDQHPADVATETADRELDLSRVAMFEARLRQIDDAFHRLKQGTYGICLDCGQSIPDERLRLVPDTPSCVKDAQRAQARAQ